MASLSRSDVEHVAYLARLGLSDAELERLEGQLNHILEQYAKLAELDTEAIPPTAQTIELENILRDDVVTPSLPVEAVVGNAPARAGDIVIVPPLLGGDEAPARGRPRAGPKTPDRLASTLMRWRPACAPVRRRRATSCSRTSTLPSARTAS